MGGHEEVPIVENFPGQLGETIRTQLKRYSDKEVGREEALRIIAQAMETAFNAIDDLRSRLIN